MKKILFGNCKNIVSQQVRLQRVSAGLSQGQLAAQMQTMGVNIDQQMISRIEKNERLVTDYELACFCQVFDVDPNVLLTKILDDTK